LHYTLTHPSACAEFVILQFVLVVGFNYSAPTQLLVHDPGFNTNSYDYKEDVVGWRVFDLNLPL